MLTVENLSCFNEHEVPLFSELSFTARSGDLIFVLGANGSGKSTLLKCLSGLIVPFRGSVQWVGKRLKENRAEFHRDLFYLGHKNSLQKSLTIAENVRFAYRLSGNSQVLTLSVLENILQQWGLFDQRHMQVGGVSKGQQQRAALLPLCLAPKKLWILDEPLSGLDHDAKRFFDQQLAKHLKNMGIAIIATHFPAQRPASQIIQLGV